MSMMGKGLGSEVVERTNKAVCFDQLLSTKLCSVFWRRSDCRHNKKSCILCTNEKAFLFL